MKTKLIHLGKPLPDAELDHATPAWVAAKAPWIDRALSHALALPDDGWFVIGASREITSKPSKHRIAGRDLVAAHTSTGLMVGPAACPHMGADLSCARVEGEALICPWHGLALGPAGHGAWKPMASHDDGVLAWVRLDDAVALRKRRDAPELPARPAHFLDGVVRMDARCEPRDVIANRLDPWHGVHYHPHSFASLAVLDRGEHDITVRVAYRVAGPLVVEVDARFHAHSPRCIVMTITRGDGAGSVVETHATPIDERHTAVIEATLATSDRWGFPYMKAISGLVRPFIRQRAKRLWIDDVAYAERLYELRQRGPATRESAQRGPASAPTRPARA